MKNLCLKMFVIMTFVLITVDITLAQNSVAKKKEITPSEKEMIQGIFEEISISDQLYRNIISKGTFDETILAKIDSVYNSEGMKAGLIYEQNLNLSFPKVIEDSLWNLQHQIDLKNHLTLRGIFNTYGFISEDIIKEFNYAQFLLLLHPPKDWDVRKYLKEYSTFLLIEVEEKRMPAISYAMFCDNMKGKILREPQIYGTNQQFDPKTKTVLPPMIENLEKSNAARKKIGLPELKEGEYRLAKK